MNIITDEFDLLREVKDCVKAVGGYVIECGYVTDKHILFEFEQTNHFPLIPERGLFHRLIQANQDRVHCVPPLHNQ